ncbi:S-methyl-5-thioribose kinase [Jiangella gansuensis]|uniref:S-methyl-5-thioribose kinase n=1 Tax=Jiangella gansuensis TaxID=281473 RepID=UPI00047BDC4E|nr:S-methyl-5-thioribose kinase [Jiangella gansuensis]
MPDWQNLSAETVPAYLASVPELAGRVDVGALEPVVEVGDGNLNLVFVVRDAHGASLVLKQSLPHVRTDPSWPMTRERSAREALILGRHQAIDPGHVPALYHFDRAHYVLAIEDLSDHVVWRGELNAGRPHEYAAAELGRYVARVAFGTSVLGLDPLEQKRVVAAAVNPELCEITEDLVFTEPYIDHEHNRVLPANKADVDALRSDRELLREIGLLKFAFMTRAQALIHGDLHTGSVFVRAAGDGLPASVRAFDSEFGFYGPIAFDLGAVWANLLLAAARSTALGDDARAAVLLAELPERLWRAFETELRALWPRRLDPRVWGDDMLELLLAEVRHDAAGYAAAKAVRRIVGFAKVSDIETLDEGPREGAARGVLRAARGLAVLRNDDADVARLSAAALAVLRGTATR